MSLVVLFLVACDDLPEDVVAPDAHPPPNDVGPCGPLPVVFCFEGEIGRLCGDTPALMTCNGTYWSCATGTVVPSDCGCRLDHGDGGNSGKPGDVCPSADAGPETGSETGSDAPGDADASD